MHIIISNIVAQIDNNASGIIYLDKRIKESDKMLLNVVGYMLCALGGGIIGGVVGRRDSSNRGLTLSSFAILCLIIGTMAVML